MVSGGARFTGGAKPKAAPRVIDVEARPRHETLYDALVVPPDTSTREIRRVARTLRRNHPDSGALHDICLAEEVLGRASLRTEYDALLARLRAANQPIPKIGTAIEGSSLGPSFASRAATASAAGAAAAGRLVRTLLKVAFIGGMLIAVCVALGTGKSRDPYKIDVHVPKFEFHPVEFDSAKFQRELDEITRQQQLDLQKRLDEIDRQYKVDPPPLDPPPLDPPPLDPPKPKRGR
jgi:hypothetical protein